MNTRFLEGMFIVFLEVAVFWFWTWLFKPNIDSGLVWLLALMFGVIMENLYWIREHKLGRRS